MKTNRLPIIVITIAAFAILSGCGKTKRTNAVTDSAAPTTTIDQPYTPPPPPTCTQNCGGGGGPTQAPYSYEFSLNGDQVAKIDNIVTDNVLKVQFTPGANQGNHTWKATELKVTIQMNGTEVTPTYTSNNYVYGQIGEKSNVIDLSAYITPGQKVSIIIKAPMNDWYCVYPYYNPLYQQYPGCRKEVHKSHTWGGVLKVQTSATTAL